MPSKKFFDEMSEQSEVKTEIVRKYFWAWATVITRQVKKVGRNQVAFVDLFAGRGRYNDGTPSTPILILEGAIKDEKIAPMLVSIFNDADPDNATALDAAIKAIPGLNLLNHQPVVRNYTVDDSLAAKFDGWKIPTLFFLDPFGYKGLSRRLISATLKPWGSDCIFFFNYNRINAALSNPVFAENMNAFFGKERAQALQKSLAGKRPAARQSLIISALKEVLHELGAKHTLEYFFKDDSGAKTSHFLIFATKNVLGYDIMKSIMAGESSSTEQGVASFGFNPLDKNKGPTLFELNTPVDDLAEELASEFEGQTLTAEEVYHRHSIGRNYVLKNYQEALKKLEAAGRITTAPPAEERTRRGRVTFGKTVVVTFLRKKG
jgi:three-Cys-motif partner protein